MIIKKTREKNLHWALRAVVTRYEKRFIIVRRKRGKKKKKNLYCIVAH